MPESFDQIREKFEKIDATKETIVAHLNIDLPYGLDPVDGEYCFFGIYGDMITVVKREHLQQAILLRQGLKSEDHELDADNRFQCFDISEDEVLLFYNAPIVRLDSLY